MKCTKAYQIMPDCIGKMTIRELKPYEKAYNSELEDKMNDEKFATWLSGFYTVAAINASNVGNSQWYVGKNHKPIEYPKKPIGLEEENKTVIDDETSEEIAILKMKNMISEWEKQGLPKAPE